jgi:serine/threonine-protein phosphatase 2A regulatory subunit B
MQLLTASAADIISTVEFDQTGNYLATGDKGGRVVLFERNETVCTSLL